MKIHVLLKPSQASTEPKQEPSTEDRLVRLMVQEIEARSKRLKPKAFKPQGASKK